MKKRISILTLILCLCLLAGCAGTPVIYHADCDCPEAGETAAPSPPPNKPAPDGGLHTGLAISTSIRDSFPATAEKAGEGKYDVTMVAVLVDNDGVIRDCIIDGIAASVKFDTNGQIVADQTAPQTKNELGDAYGMVAWGNAIAEWDKQAKALADFAIGKTVNQLKNGAVDESGYAPDGSDLASSATIYLAGYVSVIETAVKNASYLGAASGDKLCMAAQSAIASSVSATAEKDGTTQLDVDVTALTMRDGVITSCTIDSVQAKVSFDASGAITTPEADLKAAVKTKNELGDAYGMVAWGGAIAEWDKQAAAFAAYVTGKTPAEVAGIAVNEGTKPTDADLSASVTIAIGGFQALIQKAAK